MIDTHYHLNMSAISPVSELQTDISENGLTGVVIILNYKSDIEFFIENIDKIYSISNIHTAVLLDKDTNALFDKAIEALKKRKLSYSIKLHPRLSHITNKDIGKIADTASKYNPTAFIIDGFCYGANTDYWCFGNLAVKLAERYPGKKIVIAHSGGCRLLETKLQTWEIPNIYYDISLTSNYLMNTSVINDMANLLKYGKERVMWGSDHPTFSVSDALTAAKDILSDFNLESHSDALFAENAHKIFFNP